MPTSSHVTTGDAPAGAADLGIPVAPRRPHTWHRPTGDVDDHFAWMRDVDDPEFRAYVEAENAYAEAWFTPHRDTVEQLFGEIRSRVRETDLSTPVPHGSWWYVTRTVEGLDYPIHHRGPSRDDATEHLLLDENVEADGHDYFDLGAFDLSFDHSRVAWAADTVGDEHYRLRVRDLTTGHDLDDVIDDVANAGTAWSADGTYLFYVTADDQERPFRVWRHVLGTSQSDDAVVYEEDDERFFVAVGVTRSERWIVIHSASKTSSEVRLIPTDDPTAQPQLVFPRREGIEYSIDHWGDVLVALTNDAAVDFRVLGAPAEGGRIDADAWSELVDHVPGRRITGLEPFAGHLVLHEWSDAQPRLRILFGDGGERIVDLGDEPHDVDLAANPTWDTAVLRFGTQSLTRPPTLYEEDVRTGERTLLRRLPTPNVDLDAYVAHRTWATSPDGTRVPVDVVRHVDTAVDGSAPGVLYGYGAYEASLPPWFSVARLSLLDRGFVWALAHPRGGGEFGRQWYLDGKLEAKENTFTDTITAAGQLVADGVVAEGRLAIRGGSAGGLLVGACVVRRPDLFAAAVAEVPFVDIVATMSDPTLPLTVTEWEEWGDPRQQPFAEVMQRYSPYDNTVAADYPALYVTAGMHDPRVSVHEPVKWVARLRERHTGTRPVVLRVELDAGHGGPSGRYDAWRDEARTLAFLLATV